MRFAIPLLTLSALTALAKCQTGYGVTVYNANMVYTQGALPVPPSNLWAYADLKSMGSTSTDNLWSLWWYFRVAGDSREHTFAADPAPNAPTRTLGSSVIVTTWPNVYGRGLFSALLTETVVSTGIDRGYVVATMQLTNISNAPLSIDMFSLSDLEAGGSSTLYATNVAWGDVHSQYTEVNNSTLPGIEYYCPDNDRVQVDVFSTVTPGRLPFALSNTTVDDLTGWNGTFGPGDHNGAYQWHRTIPAQGTSSYTVYVAMTGNRPLQSLYGTAGSGSAGLPTIGSSERAIVDPTGAVPRGFDVRLGNALPSTAAVLITNFAQTAQVYQGIQIWVDPIAAASRIVIADANGAASAPIALPPWPSLYGLELDHQFVVLDSGAANGFAAWTQGLSQHIGTW